MCLEWPRVPRMASCVIINNCRTTEVGLREKSGISSPKGVMLTPIQKERKPLLSHCHEAPESLLATAVDGHTLIIEICNKINISLK